MMDEQVKRIMQNLQVDEKTAKEIVEDDKRIDRGEKLFELTAEQKAAEKQAKNAGTRTVYNFTPRKRKQDELKHDLFQCLDDALCDWGNNVTVLTQDRELLVEENGRTFKVTISCPRS